MKISAVQLQSFAGDIASNIAKHLEFTRVAVAQGADLVFFPELSLTGYEPQLAQSLATDTTDLRLDVFQQCSDVHNITIGVGLPRLTGSQVQIGMIWFTPNAPRQTYAKQQLHIDEIPFFGQGDKQLVLRTPTHTVAPAICYESLQQSHADHAANLSADVYLASVAKSADGLPKAMLHYPSIARQHRMYVLMANCIGPCDNFISAGQSAVWNKQGELLVQMDSESEGILMMNTISNQASIYTLVGI
ncbi:carbon-nitrogen hydrolase family protein [Leptolyngbya sp. FACHB-261]|uniref:carbon-nitrogen hydrolase family protein n=1 Tax=Leptolyngbya sp. FACHB-261 TaxID=2692806 RepID=UPI0016870769|nr:carbon-nitrogen hydrolase family protein [Leptolyngbya sp. FACHB-261]MBD2104307.1 carbon-nitrogen hydrolase family protein [Leptolyngbya sp. FACHB-261]